MKRFADSSLLTSHARTLPRAVAPVLTRDATMANSEEILLKIVAPSVGFVLANAMFFSSVPAMLRCKRLGNLAGALAKHPHGGGGAGPISAQRQLLHTCDTCGHVPAPQNHATTQVIPSPPLSRGTSKMLKQISPSACPPRQLIRQPSLLQS